MLDEVISTVEQARELPAVKKVSENEFVKKRLNQFEKLLKRVVKRNSQEAKTPSKTGLTTVNWILINLAIISYFVGKAHALKANVLEYLIDNILILGLYSIIGNLITALFLGLGKILKNVARKALRIAELLAAIFLVYWVAKKVYIFFRDLFSTDEEH